MELKKLISPETEKIINDKLLELESLYNNYFYRKNYSKNELKKLNNDVSFELRQAKQKLLRADFVNKKAELKSYKDKRRKEIAENQVKLKVDLNNLKKEITIKRKELDLFIRNTYDDAIKSRQEEIKPLKAELKNSKKDKISKNKAILFNKDINTTNSSKISELKKIYKEECAALDLSCKEEIDKEVNSLDVSLSEKDKKSAVKKIKHNISSKYSELKIDKKINLDHEIAAINQNITDAKTQISTDKRFCKDRIRELNNSVLSLVSAKYSLIYKTNNSHLSVLDRMSRYFKETRYSFDWNVFYRENKAWIYLLPALILLLIFTVYPIINTIRIAFLEGYSPLGSLGGQIFPIGFGNFTKVIKYPGFLTALKNTMVLTILTVPISCFLALIVSVFLNSITKFSRTFQTIYFLPYVTNSIAIGMVFAAMFNIVGLQPVAVESYTGSLQIYNQYVDAEGVLRGFTAESWGIVNYLIMLFGGNPINWINVGSSYVANITVMVIYIIWNALPFKILILLGGLQSVNKQYYEAAKIDGASKGTVFWRITVPMLSPMIAYVVITGFIGGFKEYSSIVGVFGEGMGPAGNAGSLNTIVGMIYDSLSSDNYGRASAAALILFVIILAVTLVNLYVSKKKVHY